MYKVIGVVIGLIVNHFIIKPFERKRDRKKLIGEGLVPKKEVRTEAQGMKDCRNCIHWESCPCGKQGHEKGTSIGYSIGECKDYSPKSH